MVNTEVLCSQIATLEVYVGGNTALDSNNKKEVDPRMPGREILNKIYLLKGSVYF